MSCILVVKPVKPVVPAGMGMVLARVRKYNTTPIPAVPVPATPQVYPYPCPTLFLTQFSTVLADLGAILTLFTALYSHVIDYKTTYVRVCLDCTSFSATYLNNLI
jgi:hypothetical protein